MEMEISKEFTFDSSHRLHNPNKSKSWNKKVFGKCNNTPSHGHRWKLVVTVIGIVNPDSGFVVNFNELSAIVNETIIEKFDHHFINELAETKHIVPSCENMVPIIATLLKMAFFRKKVSYRLHTLSLYETPTSWATLKI